MKLNLVEIIKTSHGASSQYSKYDGRLVVAINGSGDMLLLTEIYEQMGKPRYCKVLEDSSAKILVLRPSENPLDRKVSTPKDSHSSNGRSHKPKHPKLSLRSLLESRGYIINGRSAVYRAENTEDGFTINMRQSPEIVV